MIDGSTGKVDLTAASDVAINAAVLNPRSGAAFNATAGRDVVVNAIDRRARRRDGWDGHAEGVARRGAE